jgi:hypothetical protein
LSVRYLYRVLPSSKRICSYWRCQTTILRNLTRTEDGRLWHYGCLQTAKDEQFRCLECGSTLDGTGVTYNDYADGRPTLGCGNCGATIRMPSNFRAVMKIGNL